MLRSMCGETIKDKISNECFRDHLEGSIGDKIREI